MILVVEVHDPIMDSSIYLDNFLEKALIIRLITWTLKKRLKRCWIFYICLVNILRMNLSLSPYIDRPSGQPPKLSIEEDPKLDLKSLPPYIHYAYLGRSNILPMIATSDLSDLQEEKLLSFL